MCCGVDIGGGWWMLFGGVGMLLFWGVLIGLVVWGVRAVIGRRDKPLETEDPPKIAERRFAQGEITFEEFEEIKIGLGVKSLEEAGTFQRSSRGQL